jgi:hypothetical protein
VTSGQDGACAGVALTSAGIVTEDYIYDSVSGGETEITVPIDFPIGGKMLDVYLNGQRLVYTRQYIEATVSGQKGIQFQSFSLNSSDVVYIVFRRSV